MEAGAVFLIVAGVLLGPIEPGYKPRVGLADEIKCYWDRYWSPKKVGTPERAKQKHCSILFTETLEETCERAIREIGAVSMTPDPLPGYTFVPQPVYPGSVLKPLRGLLFDERVVCIPAPSGLAW